MTKPYVLWVFVTASAVFFHSGCDRNRTQAQLRAELRTSLQIPIYKNPLKPELVASWKKRETVFERVRFQGRRDDFIPALICYSELAKTRPLPVILCMPGSPNRKEDLLHPVQLLTRLARRGYFVVSIDRPYHGERDGDSNTAIRQKGVTRVLGEYVYDLMRTVDYVQTRTEADGKRIGMLGLSMGGMEALLMGALDSRVGVVVSVAGQLSWDEIFSAGSWKTVFPGFTLTRKLIRSNATNSNALEAFKREFPDMDNIDSSKISKLVSPKPLLLMTGDEDRFVPPSSTLKTYNETLVEYQASDVANRISVWIEPEIGHAFSKEMEKRALEWFTIWL